MPVPELKWLYQTPLDAKSEGGLGLGMPFLFCQSRGLQ